MNEFKPGDRVKVAKDLSGYANYVGQYGTVRERAKCFEGDVACGVGVQLDGTLGVLEFDPAELLPEDAL